MNIKLALAIILLLMPSVAWADTAYLPNKDAVCISPFSAAKGTGFKPCAVKGMEYVFYDEKLANDDNFFMVIYPEGIPHPIQNVVVVCDANTGKYYYGTGIADLPTDLRGEVVAEIEEKSMIYLEYTTGRASDIKEAIKSNKLSIQQAKNVDRCYQKLYLGK